MKPILRLLFLLLAGLMLPTGCSSINALSAKMTPTFSKTAVASSRLTVELRDGSRVVGTSVEPHLRFHSALLGDFKLDVKDIRSIDCSTPHSARLTAANGDVLMVSFVDSEFTVDTSFGKVKLQSKSVRQFSVLADDQGAALPRPPATP